MAGNFEISGFPGGIRLGEDTHHEDDSGISSPPLWKKSLPLSSTKASPLHDPRLLPSMGDLRRGITRKSLESGNPIGRMKYNSGYFSRIEFNPQYQRIEGNYENSGNSSEIEFRATGNSSEIDFRAQTHQDESGVSSPPLWKTTSPPDAPTTPKAFPPPHLHHQYLSPTSRSLAIAKGRRELMEMIQNMPESAYELSLKDIVESPTAAIVRQETVVEDVELANETIEREKKRKKRKVKRRVSRSSSGSMDSGSFLLKMFFPTSLGLHKSSKSANTCSKVSPRPVPAEGEKVGVEKSVDGEWWKRRFSLSGESEGSRISRGSSSSSSRGSRNMRNMGGFLPGCWSFFHTIKSKNRGQ